MQYLHGGDIYRNAVEYDFSINVNPLGMPPECIRAANEGILLSASRYPDYQGEALCQALAEKEEIQKEQISLGNGAAELIYGLCQFLRPHRGKMAAPSFQEYERALESVGAELVFWDLCEEDDFAVPELFAESVQGEEDIIFLCNPNNPTGCVVEKSLLQKIAMKCEAAGTYLCIDECFLPFLGAGWEKKYSMIRELEEYPHLVVLRAFTKIYGMPGLRMGYICSADKNLLEGIRSVLQPWNTSIPAQMAAVAALQCDSYLAETYKLMEREKEYLKKELLNGLVKKIYPSKGNFLFFTGCRDLKERLLEKKILIRSCGDFRNLSEGYFRIAVRTHGENEVLIRRWRELLRGDGGIYGKSDYDTGDDV